MARKARSVVDVLLGEAGGATPQDRLTEMLGIASVIENRARALGITPEEVVAQENQFHAYNNDLPPGVEKYSGLAKQALDYVKQNGPVTPAHYFSKTGTPAPDAPGGVTVAQSGPAHTFYNGQFGGVKPASAPKGTELGVRYSPTTNDLVGRLVNKPDSHITGMDADLRGRLGAMFDAAPPDIGPGLGIYSGHRSLDRQRELYNASDKTGRWVARPSPTAPHVAGFAADLSYNNESLKHAPQHVQDWVHENAPQFGLSFPMSYEPWHVEKVEARKPSAFPVGMPSDVATPQFRPDEMMTVSAQPSIPDLAKAVYSPEVAGIVSPENVSASSLPEVAAMTSPEVASAYSSPERAVSPAIEAISAMDVNPIDTGVPRSAFDVMSVESSPAAIAGRTVGAMVGPESLPPDRPMPMGSMSLPNLNQIQDTPPSLPANVPDLPAAVAQYDTPPADLPEFPTAPEEPSNWSKFKTAASPVVSNAMLGNTVAGLPGMVAGAALGLAPQFGLNLDLGPQFDAAVPQKDRFSTGYGLGAISAAMGGPFGATGHSLSNPGMSYVSLGPKAGTGGVGLRRSDKYGWTEVVGPNGEVRGIRYDNPTGGGIFGSLSRALSDRFGGGFTDAERSYADTHAGLF